MATTDKIKYFYDTYAIFEYVYGSPDYQRYFKPEIGITTRLNLMEFYYHYHLIDDEYAKEVYLSFLPICVDFTDEELFSAMKKRHEMRKKKRLKLSYIDALGYTISLERGLIFLTGDEEFENLEQVEYVK